MSIGIPIGLVFFIVFCLGALVGLFIGTVATVISINTRRGQP